MSIGGRFGYDDDGEIDLLLTLIETEPHATDLAFGGELQPPPARPDIHRPGLEAE